MNGKIAGCTTGRGTGNVVEIAQHVTTTILQTAVRLLTTTTGNFFLDAITCSTATHYLLETTLVNLLHQ